MSVVGIFVNPGAKTGPMTAVEEVRALAGQGLRGNRYFFEGQADPSLKTGPDREITLIESEAVEAVPRESGIPLEWAETRRNIVTREVALNHLVGREFLVGDVLLRGIRLCEPCSHLEKLTRPGVREALIHRGGLRAEILRSGTIRVGDAVTPLPSPSAATSAR